MLTGIRFPHKITPAELDRFLESGWRPMGQGIYTTNFLRPEDGKIYCTLSARLKLQPYSFRKSLRKILKKNRQNFTVKVRKALLTQEMLRVAQAYNRAFPNKGGTEIEFYLENHRGEKVFDTWEIAVYDGSKMIAFSFFDIGERTLYSKIGLYDPDYADHSLGIYTMLEEIQYGLDQNLDYYYPGYVAVGLRTFDYKHRIGPLEYFEIQSGKWRPYALLKECHTPFQQMKAALEKLYDILPSNIPQSALFTYLFFDLNLSRPESLPYLDNPLVLITTRSSATPFTPFVTIFNPMEQQYEILQILLIGGQLLPRMLRDAPKWEDLPLTLVCTPPLFKAKEVEIIADYLGKL